jgi:hypothetical protein
MSRDAAFTSRSPYVGPSSDQGGRVIDLNRGSKVAVIILIIIIILLIIAIIIIAILRPKSTSTTIPTGQSCKVNFDCPSGKVCDISNNSCVSCLAKSDCKTTAHPLCNTTNKTCVQCLSSTDCAGVGVICNSSGSCVIQCTVAPNTVTNLHITTNSTQQVLTWTPAAGGDPTDSYIISQAANACPSTSGKQ